jgi:hypothetical protein
LKLGWSGFDASFEKFRKSIWRRVKYGAEALYDNPEKRVGS